MTVRYLKPAKVYRNLFDADFKKSRTDDGYTTSVSYTHLLARKAIIRS